MKKLEHVDAVRKLCDEYNLACEVTRGTRRIMVTIHCRGKSRRIFLATNPEKHSALRACGDARRVIRELMTP